MYMSLDRKSCEAMQPFDSQRRLQQPMCCLHRFIIQRGTMQRSYRLKTRGCLGRAELSMEMAVACSDSAPASPMLPRLGQRFGAATPMEHPRP